MGDGGSLPLRHDDAPYPSDIGGLRQTPAPEIEL